MNTMKDEQGDLSAVKYGLSFNFWDNYMILFRNLKKREALPRLKTDDLSDTPNTNTKPSAFNLHTSCDLYCGRTK